MRSTICRMFAVPVCTFAAAMIVACGDGPVAPSQQASFTVAAAGTATYVDDDGQYYCKSNYALVYSGIGAGSIYDLNQNKYICEYQRGASHGRPQYVDDVNSTCGGGYGLLYSNGSYADLWDFDDNGYVCGLIPKH